MKTKKLFLLLLTLFCIAFIWINSSMNGDESSSISSGVLGLINTLITGFGIRSELSEYIIRKAAHFTEYTILGLLLTTDFIIWKFDIKKQWFLIPFAGMFTAVIDETIQLFPEGRVSSLIDVWIDFSGIVLGFILVMIWNVFIRRKSL